MSVLEFFIKLQNWEMPQATGIDNKLSVRSVFC